MNANLSVFQLIFVWNFSNEAQSVQDNIVRSLNGTRILRVVEVTERGGLRRPRECFRGGAALH